MAMDVNQPFPSFTYPATIVLNESNHNDKDNEYCVKNDAYFSLNTTSFGMLSGFYFNSYSYPSNNDCINIMSNITKPENMIQEISSNYIPFISSNFKNSVHGGLSCCIHCLLLNFLC